MKNLLTKICIYLFVLTTGLLTSNAFAQKTASPLINSQITAPKVRLIDADGKAVGIVGLEEAQRRANEDKLDLVLVNPNATPPVCEIVDYDQYMCLLKKRQNETARNTKIVEITEIKFRPSTSEKDYQVKLAKVKSFLKEGNKLKINLRFEGKELAHQEVGMGLIKRLEADLGELAVVEQRPKMEARQLSMLLAPNCLHLNQI